MEYAAEINRHRPTAVLFLIDQSASMDEVIEVHGTPAVLDVPLEIDGLTYTHTVDGITKAECLVDALNRTLYSLIIQCSRHDGCRHYFDVGVIGYGAGKVGSALRGSLGERLLQPLPLFEQHPLRVDSSGDRGRRPDSERVPTWVEPQAEGDTPMCSALELAADALQTWCAEHPASHPPIVVNVTDGRASDGDPDGPAQRLTGIRTHDGASLLFNLFLEPSDTEPILYPARESSLPNRHARELFRISSVFPEPIRARALERGFRISEGGRMFGYKAGITALVKCFDLATRAAQLR